MVFSSALAFGLLLSTFYAALAHLLLRGGGLRLVLFILASWIGFALGEGIGDVLNITALSLGPTNVLTATIGSALAILAAAILSGRSADSGEF